MATGEFASAWRKFERACEHFNTFKSELNSWRDTEPYSIRKECNVDGSRYSVFVKINKPPRIERWSLIGGDCVQNLRCALDHIVYALAIKYGGVNPPAKERTLQFPIFDCPDEFRKKSSRLDALSDSAKTFIEGLQPYQAGNPYRAFLLRTLNEFNNSDKHRLLHVARVRVGSGQLTFETPFFGGRPEVECSLKPIEDGAELAYFTIDPPQLDVKYKIEIAIQITVNHVPAPNGSIVSPLISILAELIEGVRGILVVAQHC